KEFLNKETQEWVQEGLITAVQRQRIIKRYEGSSSGRQMPSAQHSTFTATIATCGALLVGLGVILFFASNWSQLAPWSKMALLLGAMGTVYGAAVSLDQSYPRMSRAFFFLGAILFGSNIFLVAQAYNISSHWPNGVLTWALGIIPLALLIGSRGIFGMA